MINRSPVLCDTWVSIASTAFLPDFSSDIAFDTLTLRVLKDLVCIDLLDEAAASKEPCRLVGYFRCLLHTVHNDHHSIIPSEFFEEILDLGGGDKVQRACWFAHQEIVISFLCVQRRHQRAG